MNASAANWPLTGFPARPGRKPKLNWRIESAECDASARIIEPTIRSSSNAAPNIKARKTASPALPVGDSRRRQCPTNFSLSLAFVITQSKVQRQTRVCRTSYLSQRFAAGSYRIDLHFRALDDVVRQRRVLQFLREVFPLMNSPPQKINHRFSFHPVLFRFLTH